jgi:hypothetical protein
MTRQQVFSGWIIASLVAFLFPPVGSLAGTNDSLVVVFYGKWAWIGRDIQGLDGYGRSCIHVPMLIVELLVIATAALALSRMHKEHNQ